MKPPQPLSEPAIIPNCLKPLDALKYAQRQNIIENAEDAIADAGVDIKRALEALFNQTIQEQDLLAERMRRLGLESRSRSHVHVAESFRAFGRKLGLTPNPAYGKPITQFQYSTSKTVINQIREESGN